MNHLKLFYYKWIKRACPHFCFLCAHKGWCIKENGIKQVISELSEWLQ